VSLLLVVLALVIIGVWPWWRGPVSSLKRDRWERF
jgi:hypothetical protein